jgi:hypothetical protein
VPVRCCTTVHVYDAVVIGAGQAGLSASYHLRLMPKGRPKRLPGQRCTRRRANHVAGVIPGRHGTGHVSPVAIAISVVATGEVDVAHYVEVRVAVDTGVYDVGVDVRYGTRAVA